MGELKPYPVAIAGTYLVTGVHDGRARNGTRFLRLGLTDGQRPTIAYAFPRRCHGFRVVRRGERIRLRGEWRIRDGREDILCHAIEVEDAECRIAWAKARIRLMLTWIEHQAVGGFLRQVFADPLIGPAYLDRPASIAHHHAYPGGLFVHSVEVAWRLFQEPIKADEKALLVASGLLHDVGKVRCYGADGRRTAMGCAVDHDALTLEVLALHLPALDARWLPGGIRLRHLLTWRPSREESRPADALVELLRTADRLSAGFELNPAPLDAEPDPR
jgi:3'-5' exoribonuclease